MYNGKDGTNGTNGTDGVSPTVSTEEIVGGTRVDITDVNGSHSFDVMDGVDGKSSQVIKEVEPGTEENPFELTSGDLLVMSKSGFVQLTTDYEEEPKTGPYPVEKGDLVSVVNDDANKGFLFTKGNDIIFVGIDRNGWYLSSFLDLKERLENTKNTMTSIERTTNAIPLNLRWKEIIPSDSFSKRFTFKDSRYNTSSTGGLSFANAVYIIKAVCDYTADPSDSDKAQIGAIKFISGLNNANKPLYMVVPEEAKSNRVTLHSEVYISLVDTGYLIEVLTYGEGLPVYKQSEIITASWENGIRTLGFDFSSDTDNTSIWGR